MAYFGYTKNKKIVFKDIDLLIPDKKIKKIMAILSYKKIKYKYIKDWHSVVISKKNLIVDLDPIERHCKDKKFVRFNFNGLVVNAVNLKSLTKMYERASKVSKDKPKQHFERFSELKKLKLERKKN